jgi:hypothetical protein
MLRTHLRARARLTQALFPAIIAALLCPLSALLTIELCMELWGKNVGSIIGALGWEITKLYAGMIAWRQLRHSPSLKSLCWVLVAVATISGSLAASLGAFAHRYEAQRTGTLEQSETYRNTQMQLKQVDAQIALLSQTAEADLAASYRARTLRETYPALQSLSKSRERLAGSLASFRAQPDIVLGSDYFASLGRLVGRSGDRLQLLAALLFAAVLEITCVLVCDQLGAIWTATRTASTKDTGTYRPVAPVRTGTNDTAGTIRFHRTAAAKHDTGTQFEPHLTVPPEVRDGISRGKIPPVVKSIRRFAGVSQEPARRFLAQLAEEGVLNRERSGRYRLAGEGV